MARSFTRVITTPAAGRSQREWNRPFVSLLSDWGARDPSPAICHGVVLAIAPEALVVDISHEVDKYNIRHGALLLWCALPFLPIGAHIAVVDPGVGTPRRAVAIETARGDYMVGPDNGLLLPGADRLGGIVRAHLIENPAYRLPVVSSTFHGRDLFSPAAAHLAAGVPLENIGPPIDPHSLTRLEWPTATVRFGALETSVIYIDTFGNIKLSGLTADLLEALGTLTRGEDLVVEAGTARAKPHTLRWVSTFGDVAKGELLLYEDSYGRLCIAANQGNAAKALKLEEDMPLVITRSALPAIHHAMDADANAEEERPDDRAPHRTPAKLRAPARLRARAKPDDAEDQAAE
jgi:S-adenosylmethionine hydrolase